MCTKILYSSDYLRLFFCIYRYKMISNPILWCIQPRRSLQISCMYLYFQSYYTFYVMLQKKGGNVYCAVTISWKFYYIIFSKSLRFYAFRKYDNKSLTIGTKNISVGYKYFHLFKHSRKIMLQVKYFFSYSW